MSITVYHVGDLVRIAAVFKDVNGTATDPTTITLKVKDPSGNTDTYTYAAGQITKASTGNYHRDISIDETGDWHYEWVSTGSGQGVEPGEFTVEPTHF